MNPTDYNDILARDFDVQTPPAASLKHASEDVRKRFANELQGGAAVRLSAVPVPRNQLRDLGYANVATPSDKAFDEAFVVFVDESPRTKWAHPAKYYFLASDLSRLSEAVPGELPPQRAAESGIQFVDVAAIP